MENKYVLPLILILGEGLGAYAFALLGAGLGYLIIYMTTNGLSHKVDNPEQHD